MNRIFVAADPHIPLDISKLSSKNFPEGKTLTSDDYVAVGGDFGLVWDYSGWTKEELYWKEWLESKPWTTLFVDGNHENFDRLNALTVEEWHGGKVHKVSDKIIHLMRGQVFDIGGTTIFTFGGARSIDRGAATGTETRDRGFIWWDAELPTLAEMDEGRRNLERHGNKVDYIITHDLPTKELIGLGMKTRKAFWPNYLNSYLDDIRINTEFKHWYAGHYHTDMTLSEKQTVLYQNVIPLGETLI